MIRELSGQNEGKCHLCPDTKQNNRTANGTSGCDQRTQRTKTKENVISMLIQNRIIEQPMEPVVVIREHNGQKPRKMSHLFSENSQWL